MVKSEDWVTHVLENARLADIHGLARLNGVGDSGTKQQVLERIVEKHGKPIAVNVQPEPESSSALSGAEYDMRKSIVSGLFVDDRLDENMVKSEEWLKHVLENA